jgi:hypothetical protein
MQGLTVADELAEVRAQIARLRAREASLRRALLAAGGGGQTGRRARATVEEHGVMRFDPALLPEEVRRDPRFWREERVVSVQVHALPARRPGWPLLRRGGAAVP